MCLFAQTKWSSCILLRVMEGKAKRNGALESTPVPCGAHRILSASGQIPSAVPTHTHAQPAGDGNSWRLAGRDGKWGSEKKEKHGGKIGKRRGRTLAAREPSVGFLFYIVYALFYLQNVPSIFPPWFSSLRFRHAHIDKHTPNTHTHTKYIPEAIDTVVLVSPLSALGLLRVAEALENQPPLCQCHLSPKPTRHAGAKLCWRPHLKEQLNCVLWAGNRIRVQRKSNSLHQRISVDNGSKTVLLKS